MTLSVDLITIEMEDFDVNLEVDFLRKKKKKKKKKYSIIDYFYQRVTFKVVSGKKFSYKGRQLVDHKMHLLFGSLSHKNSEVKRA